MSARLPSIQFARQQAKARGLDGMVIVSFKASNFSVASYGSTKQQCQELAKLVDFIVESVEQGKVLLPSLDTSP
jgi:aminopeptidase-like protein